MSMLNSSNQSHPSSDGRRPAASEASSPSWTRTNPPARQPIDSNDDMIVLLKTLYECQRMGQGPSAAITALNGVHGRTSTEWQTFFVANVPTIFSPQFNRTASAGLGLGGGDASTGHTRTGTETAHSVAGAVSQSQELPRPGGDAPAAASSEVAPSSASAATQSPASNSSPSASLSSRSDPQTATRHGLGLHPHSESNHGVAATAAPTGTRAGRPVHSDPEPSPPTTTVRLGNGPRNMYRFTEEDVAYFHAYLRWSLRRDPQIRLSDVCRFVAKKAVHHSARSWRGYADAHPQEIEDVKQEIAAERGKSGKTRTRLSTRTDKIVGHAHKDRERNSRRRLNVPSDTVAVNTEDDVSDEQAHLPVMGRLRQPYTVGDEYAMARYIASKWDEWDNLEKYPRQVDQWKEFAAMYPQRHVRSWSWYYREPDHYDKLNELAAMFRRRAAKTNANGEATGEHARKNASVTVIDLTRPSPSPEVGTRTRGTVKPQGRHRSPLGDASSEHAGSVYEDLRDDSAAHGSTEPGREMSPFGYQDGAHKYAEDMRKGTGSLERGGRMGM